MPTLVQERATITRTPELDQAPSFVTLVDAMVCEILRRHSVLPPEATHSATHSATHPFDTNNAPEEAVAAAR